MLAVLETYSRCAIVSAQSEESVVTSYSASELLGRGFLPAELPPIFTSRSLGAAYPNWQAQLASCSAPKDAQVLPTTFHLARPGTLRRRLSIPHPLYYAQLCSLLEQKSSELQSAFAQSPWSRSIPEPDPDPSRRAFKVPLVDRLIVEANAAVRATSRYLVQADIAQFYHSIYTHTFSWSLGSKDHSKKWFKFDSQERNQHRSEHAYQLVHFGDELDKKLRNLQDKQSVGIPMGPDASRLLAEVLLCSLDKKLDTELRQQQIVVHAMRNVDDYQIGVRTYDDAEKVLALLQHHLRTDLELTLNPRKTRIIALPAPLEDPWVTQLKGIVSAAANVPARQKRRELLRLFDVATASRSEHPEEHVYSYLLGILKHVDVDRENWALLQHMLLQIALAEAGTIRQILADLLWYQKEGNSLDLSRWKDVFERIIETHAPQEHSSEVAWALWGLRELEQKLSVRVVSAVLKMKDPIVSLLALSLASQGRCEDPADKTSLINSYQNRVTVDGFWGEHWPLVYEATRQGWLTTPSDLLNDSGYRLMKDHLISFLDFSKRIDPNDQDQLKRYGNP